MSGDMAIKQPEPSRELRPGLRLAIDLGPLLIYLGAYWFTKNIVLSTGVFMVATIAAIAVSWIKSR